MSHAPYVIPPTKAIPRSPCQRAGCAPYTQWPAPTTHHGEDRCNPRQPRPRRSTARAVEQSIHQDDKISDPAVARRRCSARVARPRSPSDVNSRKKPRQARATKADVETAPTSPSLDGRADDDNPHVLPVSEFSAVKETFLKTFKRCSELLFLTVSCALSCVLRSFRPLHKIEIAGAVILFLASRSVSTVEVACDEDLGAGWLSQCSEILTEDENGYVHFSRSSFQLFLLNYRIEGIDSTPATIATVCLLHVEIQTIQMMPRHGKDVVARICQSASKAISAYAAQFWVEHYRCVQSLRPELTQSVHRILANKWCPDSDLGDQNRSGWGSGRVTDEALKFCVRNKLHTLAQLYAQRGEQESYSAARGENASAKKATAGHHPLVQVQVQSSSPRVSRLDMVDEAFEQLDLDGSMYASSSSESEGWTKLRTRDM